MPTPLPRRDRVGALSLLPHSTAAFPEILPGRLPRFGLSRPAQRSLTFRPACSLNRPRRSVSSEASTDLLPSPPLRLLPAGTTRRRVGIAPTGNRRLCTAHNIFTLRPAADPGRVSSEECGPNATRGLAELARLDGVNAGGFRQGLQDAPEVPQCGGGPDGARADEGGMSQHRFKGTAFAYGSQSW